MINSKLLSAFLLFGLNVLFCQNVKNLSVNEGLPQSFVSALGQDDEGFIWISTRNGLARYDGLSFKIFQHNFRNKNSLASNIIDYIRKGHGNILWIKYDTGEIDKFDLNSEKIKHCIDFKFLEENQINIHRNIWLVTANNMLWFKTKNGNLYSCNLNKKNRVTNQSAILGADEVVFNILEDKSGTIWVLTQQALKKFDEKKQRFISFPIPYKMLPNQIQNKNAETVAFYERKNGEFLWTDKGNLYFFDPLKKIFRKEKLPTQSPYNIKWIDTDPKKKECFIAANSIYSYDDDKGIRAVSTIAQLKNQQPQAFLVDNSGMIWVGGDSKGVYTIDLDLDFDTFHYKKDFIVDLMKETYGISAYDFFDWKEHQPGVVQPSYFVRSASHNQKEWIALNRTVCYNDNATNKIVKLPVLPVANEGKFSPITGITFNKDIPFVIDKSNNIYFFDKNKWEFFLSLERFNLNIRSTNIYLDNKTKIFWITTESHGLIKLNLLTKKIQQVQSDKNGFPAKHLISLVPDKSDENILWIGSNNGLIRFNKRENRSELFSVKEGLPDNVIYSILQDKSGDLWMGTNKGLVKFDTHTKKSRVFTRHHGLEDIEFNRFHQFLLPDGRMAFGGMKSGVKINPERVKEDSFAPATAINRIKLNNKDISLAKSNLKPVNHIQNLTLGYFENTISIDYTALQFNQPQEIQYRYRLKGYHDDWVMAGNNREASYTKLPPGDYTFEVNASNTSGKWSNHIKSLAIKVTPPWWRTWWAMLLYFALAAGSVFWFIRYRINQEIIKNEIKLKQKEALELRKLDKIKTQFFSNIAHEFRTPLSLILGPAEKLKIENTPEDRDKLFGTIQKNTNSLIQLTDQLIDIAKLEAGVLKPQMVWGDVVVVISNIVKAFSETAAAKGITLKLDAPVKAEFLFSINTIDRILYNLISNAMKFCSEGSCINVKVSRDETGLHLTVQDNGTGIPEEEQSKIFKRYFKGTNQEELQGHGIGLSLVKELIELHQGTIEVKSSTGFPSGTVFSIWLPFEIKKNESFEYEQQNENTVERPTLLVVEDHEDLAQFLVENLQETYQVFVAKNGKKALEVALDKMPDLIVSDVAMDEMDGFEFCKAVKKNISINHIPVILLTAKADTESKLEGLSYGANDYIIKPFSITELKLRISNQLQLQNQQFEYLQKRFSLPEIQSNESDLSENNLIDAVNDEFLNRIYEIIDNNLDDTNFSVDALAHALSMSRANLHRKVKTMFNMSTGEIIKVYRLKKAAELLKRNYNISEVAYKTGFNTPSYFTKCFKEYFGCTPTEYL